MNIRRTEAGASAEKPEKLLNTVFQWCRISLDIDDVGLGIRKIGFDECSTDARIITKAMSELGELQRHDLVAIATISQRIWSWMIRFH